MVNLFQQGPVGPGRLTAALLALLEHGERGLLRGFLERAGMKVKVGPEDRVRALFPAPGGPPEAGLLSLPDRQVTVISQAPGEPWDPTALEGLTPAPGVQAGKETGAEPRTDGGDAAEAPAAPAPDGETLAITLAGRPPGAAHHLTWEQVDRWLAGQAGAYDPDSRTGFLIEQFRAFLADAGIEYFAGFEPKTVEQAPDGLAALTAFYGTADRFFERLEPALAAVRAGLAQERESRPEDLLGGYCYRDYTGGPLGPDSFLRIAFHLPQEELQVSCWTLPPEQGGSPGHARLREALAGEDYLLPRLQALGDHPLLWLWSPEEEHRTPLDELEPDAVERLPWSGRYAAVQRSLPFDQLTREGLVDRTAQMADELLEALLPVMTGVLH